MDNNNTVPSEDDSTLTVEDLIKNISNVRNNIREMSHEVVHLQAKTAEAELRLANMKNVLDKIEAGRRNLHKGRKK